MTHGAPGQPIRVQATASGGSFELSVANGGDPIPPRAMERLFQQSPAPHRTHLAAAGKPAICVRDCAAPHIIEATVKPTRLIITFCTVGATLMQALAHRR